MRYCHAQPDPSCPVCRWYDEDEGFRSAADGLGGECGWGRELTGPEREARGLGHEKRWTLCLQPERPLGREVVCSCEGCNVTCPGHDPDARPDSAPARTFEWVSTAQLVRDAILLAGKLPPDCSGVAGIPRSGMIAASVIATHLHLPLYELGEDGRLARLGHGSRGRTLGLAGPPGPLAVVDDTIYGGTAMRRARRHAAALGIGCVFAAVYARPEASGVADYFARELPSPHLLEWNFANNGPVGGFAADPVYGKGVAFDMDGIIVHDRESGGAVGSPFLVPKTHPVLIATGRRERDRPATEEHLRRVGARWSRLEMLPDDAPEGAEAVAAHKAGHFASSGCGFFAESCPVQAELINKLSGLPVICPIAGRVFAGYFASPNGAS